MSKTIDGKLGEGGGQVLRTALTLAMATGQNVVVENIRAGRKRPGLLRQHLAAIRAAAAVSGAEVEGAELGASRIAFSPQSVRAGDYQFAIGSAGSTTLLMQTVLPALALAQGPSSVQVQGGTHNGMAPSVDFMQLAYLPLLQRMGLPVSSTIDRYGFYPHGGGSWRTSLEPWVEKRPLVLLSRGDLLSRQAVATLSGLQTHVAERELERVSHKLGWAEDSLHIDNVTAAGPGNIVSLRYAYAHVTEVFESVGARGITAERVAGRAISAAKRYQAGSYPVGEHLADQLLVPLVLGAGGEFLTGSLTDHTLTNIRVIEEMLERSVIQVCAEADGALLRIPEGWR